MCGIAGHVHAHERGRRALAEEQLSLLLHRGPDSMGVHVGTRAVIGQTRLSVIDLVTGDPPITDESGEVGVALNGEIYNFAALRQRLLEEGHAFRTTGDTEVIAHLVESLEPAELARSLDGMFAFAVWDSRRDRLVLGRDRTGKKPLYYWHDGRHFVFGSEIKAVLAHPAVPRRLNRDALPSYLALGAAGSPYTLFEGIRSVPPGHVLVLGPDMQPRMEPYWTPPVPGVAGVQRVPHTGMAAAEEVRRLLEAAVVKRLVADVPLGAFLSGGIDSSLIVALMARHTSSPPRTFTIGFEDTDGFDERPHAAQVAEHVGTDHTVFVVKPQAVDLVERLVWHYDEPFGDSSAIPTFLLSELTRGHVTVALCGDGGDELFAGYERFAAGVGAHYWGMLPAALRKASLAGALWATKETPRRRGRSVQRFLAQADAGLPEAYREWISYTPGPLRRALAGDGPSPGLEAYERVWQETRGAAPLDRLLHLNLRTYLLDDLLPKVDRMSMAHSLEVRAPFLDTDLMEFALRLRPRTKVVGMSLKRVLKAAAADLLPQEILDRPKHGFGVPLDRWFRQDLAGTLRTRLGSPEARVRRHLDGAAIDWVIAEHTAGRADHGHTLWTLLTLEVFLEKHDW